MDDEFEAAFEDELEALQEMEDELHGSHPDAKSRRSLSFSTPRTNPKSRLAGFAASPLTPGQSPALGRMPSLDSPITSRGRVISDDMDDSFGNPLQLSLTEEDGEADLVIDEGEDKENQGVRASKKRTQDDMFQGLSDDEEDPLVDEGAMPNIAPRAKRARTNKVPDTEFPDLDFDITPPPSPGFPPSTIKKSSHDALRDQISKLQEQVDKLRKGEAIDWPRVHKRIPSGNFLSVTGSLDGERAYMKLREESLTEKIDDDMGGARSLQLLGTPLEVLRIQIEEERRKKLIDSAKKVSHMVHREVIEEDFEEVAESDSESKSEHALWVERYSPRNYTDLISDESTNRILLKWLKMWDYVVFDKEKKAPVPKKEDKKDKKKQFIPKGLPELPSELDQYNRPMHKVALLCGPPGLGKTTLSHIIAKHAGYNVVEMNASDDRSPDIFKTRIEAATQMKSVLQEDRRPNCLIIDEIDGAPQPAINMLLTMIKGGEANPAEKKKKKKKIPLLMRPIICICNELYVPALRNLRQVALVVNFPPTLGSSLATRLLEVARREQIKADMTTMLALCEKADNDIRSCLNTLQFIKGRCPTLTLNHVNSMSLGQKDAHKSLFSVWQIIFQMPKPKRKRYVNPYDRASTASEAEAMAATMAQNNLSHSSRFNHIFDVAMAAGDSEKIMQGLYENYLKARIKDPRMEAVQAATDWIEFVDILQQRIAHTQNYVFGRYTSYLPVMFHLLFASNHPERIQFPLSQNEARMKTNKNESLVMAMLNDVAPSVKKHLNLVLACTEMLDPLLDIIQPTLRPVNTQLYSRQEKADLRHLIEIMIAYNLTYQQERGEDGQYSYKLDPGLEEVVRFPGQKVQRPMTYAAKQLISREIELERMRRSEAASGTKERNDAPPPLPSTPKQPKPSASKDSPSTKAAGSPSVPNHLQTLTPRAIRPKDADKFDSPEPIKTHRDFFGREISRSEQKRQKTKKESKTEIIGGDIWFRFKEGFTNAVCKTVRMQDLL